MQRILQINIAGSILPIEEDAYNLLKDYISSLERQFKGEDGFEIIADIENRIAELFDIRLKSGSPAIDRSDVQKVIDTLGTASDLRDGSTYQSSHHNRQNTYTRPGQPNYAGRGDRLLRDPYDKVVGGVCSGMSIYFDLDPVIIRLITAVLCFFGAGFIVYIIAWAVIPAARSREELFNMNNGVPVTFHDISRNVESELQDLKRRGEQMSRDLKEFFGRKK